MRDTIRRTIETLKRVAESAKHACEDCQEFTCDGCEYYGVFDNDIMRIIAEAGDEDY